MKKVILGIFIGIILTVISYFIYLNVRTYSLSQQIETRVMDCSRRIFSNTFPDAKVNELGLEPSKDYVNFTHDKLFRITIHYERKEQFKVISFNMGVYKNHIITPPELELLTLDRKAPIVFDKKE